MNRKWFFILITSMMIFALAACAGADEVTTGSAGDQISQAAPEDPDTASNSNAETTVIKTADIFSQRCSGCHGADREGNNGPALLPGVLTKDPSEYINSITNGSGPMPAWGSRLSTDEIKALVEFILSEVE